jgi:hypothetical protein
MTQIIEARLLAARPACIPLSRPRKGSKVYGLRYEKALADAVRAQYPRALHGQWIAYRRSDEPTRERYCQPDVLIPLSDCLVVLECKLTETEEGREQILHLYVPALRQIVNKDVFGIVVARHLTRETRPETVVRGLDMALMAMRRCIPTLHWLGKGRI